MRATIQLIDDLEDGFFAFRWGRVGEEHPYAQVVLGALLLGISEYAASCTPSWRNVRIVPHGRSGSTARPRVVVDAFDRALIHHCSISNSVWCPCRRIAGAPPRSLPTGDLIPDRRLNNIVQWILCSEYGAGAQGPNVPSRQSNVSMPSSASVGID